MIKKAIITVIIFVNSFVALSQSCYEFYNSKGESMQIMNGPDGKAGIYNFRTNRYVQPCKYFLSAGFTAIRNGFAVARNENDQYGIFNTDGEIAVPFRYKHIGWIPLSDELFIAQIANGNYGVINTKGQIVAPFVFEHISSQTRNGLIVAKANGKYGLIDFYGNTAHPFIYDALYLEEEYRYPLSQIGNYTKDKNLCFARVIYNGYDYRVDENWNVIGERKRIVSANSYTKKSSMGALFVAGAIIAGAAALISSSSSKSSSSSSYSSSSSSSSSPSSTSRTLYEGCSVRCFKWSKGSGYYGRVTAINGNKCKVYIDKVVLKGLLTLYISASEYTGWKDLSYTTHYDYNMRKQFYGCGEIIEVPISCLE